MILFKLKCWKFALLMLLLTSTILKAQDFRPGFVVTLQGDSLIGLVENRSLKKNEEECHFKSSKKSNAVSYQPTDLNHMEFLVTNNTNQSLLPLKIKKSRNL